MKLSEKLKERLKLLIVNRLAVESSSPASYLSGYRQAIRDVEMAEVKTDKDKTDMMRVIEQLLGRLDDLLEPPEGELSIHSHGQTPDWFVEAAFLSAFGTLDKVYPVSPRLNPEGDGYICDTCDRTWAVGQSSGCELCREA